MKRYSSFTLESSHGTIDLDAEGVPTAIDVDNDDDGTPCYLREVAKFDVDEFYNYLANGWGEEPFEDDEGGHQDGDVLNMGYWRKDGTYVKPPKEWRETVFKEIID